MSNTPLRLLLDTNVLLDEYLPMRPGSQVSRTLLCTAQEQGLDLLYPARVLVDIHYQIASTLKRLVRAERGVLSESDAQSIQRIAWSCIDNLCEFATAVGLDESDIWLARKYRRFNGDFEDNFVLAAAERAQVDYLVTSDQKLLRKATVAALSPADMLSLLEARAVQP